MNRDQQIALIRQKCIEATRKLRQCSNHGVEFSVECEVCRTRPISLSLVLLALEKADTYSDRIVSINSAGLFEVRYAEDGNINVEWNLRKDDLTEQTDKCITFLTKLLQ